MLKSSFLFKGQFSFFDSDFFVIGSPVLFVVPLFVSIQNGSFLITPTYLVLTWKWVGIFECAFSTSNLTCFVGLLDSIDIHIIVKVCWNWR
jgi:hypothetical protein